MSWITSLEGMAEDSDLDALSDDELRAQRGLRAQARATLYLSIAAIDDLLKARVDQRRQEVRRR